MGQDGSWLSPAFCTTASTRTRDVGKEGANEEPLQHHGGSAPPYAELLPCAGGHCPWASAEEGTIKPQVRQQVTHSKCNWRWWQGAHRFKIGKGKEPMLTASPLTGTRMEKTLGWYPWEQFCRQPLLKRRWQTELKLSKYAMAWHLQCCPLPFPAGSFLPSSPVCKKQWRRQTYRQETREDYSNTGLTSAHVATKHGPA